MNESIKVTDHVEVRPYESSDLHPLLDILDMKLPSGETVAQKYESLRTAQSRKQWIIGESPESAVVVTILYKSRVVGYCGVYQNPEGRWKIRGMMHPENQHHHQYSEARILAQQIFQDKLGDDVEIIGTCLAEATGVMRMLARTGAQPLGITERQTPEGNVDIFNYITTAESFAPVWTFYTQDGSLAYHLEGWDTSFQKLLKLNSRT